MRDISIPMAHLMLPPPLLETMCITETSKTATTTYRSIAVDRIHSEARYQGETHLHISSNAL